LQKYLIFGYIAILFLWCDTFGLLQYFMASVYIFFNMFNVGNFVL